MTINNIQVQASPHHVFAFNKKDGVDEIGAIWFIAKLDGFSKHDLGMFADILQKYLKTHFFKKHKINSKYCIAVDVFKNTDVTYLGLKKKETPRLLKGTLNELADLLKIASKL